MRTILHTAGTVAQPNRNGTTTFYQAMALLTDLPIKAIVSTQRDTIGGAPPPNVEVRVQTLRHHWDLYSDEFDMMVLPRRWGGLCLPMQEALTAGMPVLMPDCAPNNQILPSALLTPAALTEQLMAWTLIDLYDVHPGDLAQHIRWMFEHPEAVEAASSWAGEWARGSSWAALRGQYLRILGA